MSNSTETVIAVLTPPGAAAIATLALHGPRAWTCTRRHFQPVSKKVPESIADVSEGQFWFGKLGTETSDEVVFVLKQIEPIPCVEIHSHGGREVLRLLLALFRSEGINEIDWQEYQQRIASTPLQALAISELAHAPTVRTASILLDQSHGALERELAFIMTLISSRPTEAAERLRQLITFNDLGRHLTTPWKVVIAGAPNVGKSSIINALSGYQRAVVSDIPGTTRDVVTTSLAIDGWPIEFADTAGLRKESDALESAGIALAQQKIAASDLCIQVVETQQSPQWIEDVNVPEIRVINKNDLQSTWDLSAVNDGITLSAKTGQGIAALCDAISCQLVPVLPKPGQAMAFTKGLATNLEFALKLLERDQITQATTLIKALFENSFNSH